MQRKALVFSHLQFVVFRLFVSFLFSVVFYQFFRGFEFTSRVSHIHIWLKKRTIHLYKAQRNKSRFPVRSERTTGSEAHLHAECVKSRSLRRLTRSMVTVKSKQCAVYGNKKSHLPVKPTFTCTHEATVLLIHTGRDAEHLA